MATTVQGFWLANGYVYKKKNLKKRSPGRYQNIFGGNWRQREYFLLNTDEWGNNLSPEKGAVFSSRAKGQVLGTTRGLPVHLPDDMSSSVYVVQASLHAGVGISTALSSLTYMSEAVRRQWGSDVWLTDPVVGLSCCQLQAVAEAGGIDVIGKHGGCVRCPVLTGTHLFRVDFRCGLLQIVWKGNTHWRFTTQARLVRVMLNAEWIMISGDKKC